MPTEREYQTKIKAFTWEDLRGLWDAIQQQVTPGWEPGKALEYLILRTFQLERADVRWPYSVRLSGEEIEQIDGVIYSGDISCLIECKDHNAKDLRKKNVNFEPIAKMRSQLLRRPASTIGCVFSSGDFTEPALILANFTFPQTILLWNAEEIDYCLSKRQFRLALQIKYRKCIELGIHDYDIFVKGEL